MDEYDFDYFYELPEVQAAARWWAAKVSSPEPYDNGDPHSSAMANILSTGMLQVPTANAIAAFVPALRKRIAEWLAELVRKLPGIWDADHPEFGRYHRTLGCDYGPDLILGLAAKDAGVPESAFPWKTILWISPGKVEVKEGYGAASKTIWPLVSVPDG